MHNRKLAQTKAQPKKVVKQQKRKIATTKKTIKKTTKNIANQTFQQQTASIATATTKQKQFTPTLNTALVQELATANAAFAPQLATLTTQQRAIKIRSFQLAFTKNWLCRRGLFYEDIWEESEDVKVAVDMLPADVRKDRLRRLIRSVDLDLKLCWLPPHMQDYDPFTSYGLDDAIIKYDLFAHEWDNYV